MADQGRQERLYRNRSPFTLGSICPGKSVALGPGGFGSRAWEIRFMVLRNPQFFGAYAEICFRFCRDGPQKSPTSLTHIEAASVPVVAVTAQQALFDQAQLKAGQTVV